MLMEGKIYIKEEVDLEMEELDVMTKAYENYLGTEMKRALIAKS